jgi:hypothetical protein
MKDSHAGTISGGIGSHEYETRERHSATVIVNADDWGRDVPTTDRTLDCALRGVISSVGAMLFMEDSKRAADIARQHDIDAGLHLNFTMLFTSPRCPGRLLEHQARLSRFLTSHRLAPLIYHPGLAASFEYVVKTQLEEYERLYGAPSGRMDGHHHMHLCMNVMLQKLIPSGVIVRRNFTFGPGEKGYFNRLFRGWQDRQLARRYRITDYFFDLLPLQTSRLKKIFELANRFNVEIETHAIDDAQYRFLLDREFSNCAGDVGIARGYVLRSNGCGSEVGAIV